jgi:hypothetical protein
MARSPRQQTAICNFASVASKPPRARLASDPNEEGGMFHQHCLELGRIKTYHAGRSNQAKNRPIRNEEPNVADRSNSN